MVILLQKDSTQNPCHATTQTPMSKHASEMRLYDKRNQRLYINASERKRFIKAAKTQPLHIQTFALTLLYTGCRLSEARELDISRLQADEQLLAIRSLKKRNKHHIREIPIPVSLVQSLTKLAAGAKGRQTLDKLKRRPKNLGNASIGKAEKEHQLSQDWFWTSEAGDKIDRITAYRWIKTIMREAGIHGPQACPKGLRHGFGIHAVVSGIQLNMLQKWMGHASIQTTAIYANAVGPEELKLAGKMW